MSLEKMLQELADEAEMLSSDLYEGALDQASFDQQMEWIEARKQRLIESL